MKKLLFVPALFAFYIISAQNMGIGTNTPQATLDVKGNHRMGGLSNYITHDSASGRIGWKNSNLYVPASQFLMKHSAAGEGLFYNNTAPASGQLEYRDAASNPVFFTNFTNGNGYFSGKLGIGIDNPSYKLHVNNGGLRVEGISNNTPSISMSSTGNFEVDAPFVPGGRFIIKEDGKVGIGTTNPLYKLDIAGRIRLQSSGGFNTAGLYLNNNNNSLSPAFIGMQDDTHVGFWGNGSGWKFTMNTQTGALKINDSEGTAGQVLQSNGSNAPPAWGSSTNTLYNTTNQVIASSAVTVSNGSWTPIPGLTYSFTTAGNAKALVMFNVAAFATTCTGCGISSAYISINHNGSEAKRFKNDIADGETINFNASYLIQVGAGNHTIDLRASQIGPAMTFAFGVIGNNMIVQVIPE